MKYQYDADTVGNIIKTRRKALKLTQQQLADMISVNKSTVSRYESNEIGNMTVESLVPLAKALNCSPMQLLGVEPMDTDIKQNELSLFEQSLLFHFAISDAKTKRIVLQLLDMENEMKNRPIDQ